MLLKIAWKNIWRNRTRSLVVIISVIIGLWAALFMTAFSWGLYQGHIDDSIENYLSHLQIHHPSYPAEKMSEFSIPEGSRVFEAVKKGIIFEVGHGGGSFRWSQAIPAIQQGFLPDAISSDLHIGSMNGGMKDMANLMSKFLNLGLPIQEVVLRSTWNPAKIINRRELGNLSVGTDADVAVFSLRKGDFGFIDVGEEKIEGTQKLEAEMTIRAGKIVWDLNGLAAKVINK